MTAMLFIDYSNEKQVAWFNKKGHRMASWKIWHTLNEKETGKEIGLFLIGTGIFAKKAAEIGKSFVKDPVTMTTKEILEIDKRNKGL